MSYLARFAHICIALLLLGACTHDHPSSSQPSVAPALPQPKLTVAGVIHVCPHNTIALIERAKEPWGLALFGAHVKYETPEAAFVRVAQVELNISDLTDIQLIGVHGAPGRDSRQHSVEVTFSGITHQTPTMGSDTKAVHLYTWHQIEPLLHNTHFAFDHRAILQEYKKRLGNCNPCEKHCSVGITPSLVNSSKKPT